MGPPERGSAPGGQQYRHQKRTGQAVHQLRQLRTAGRRLLHQGYDLSKTGLGAGAFHPYQHRRIQVVAAGDDGRPYAARQRARFARQQRLIGQCFTLQHRAIGRKRFTGQHPHHVTRLQPAHGHAFEFAITTLAQHTVGQAVHQRVQRAGRALAQAHFQPAAGEQEEDEHRQRIEVHLLAEGALRVESAGSADREGDGHAQRHRQVHADAPLQHFAQRSREKGAAGKQHDRQGQHPGGPAQQLLHLGRQVTRLGHIGRPRIHHDLHHAQARHQPLPQGLASFLAAPQAGKGVVRRYGQVAGTAHSLHPARRLDGLGLPDDPGTAAAGTDAGARHARHPAQRLLDGERAGRAVHGLDHQMGFPAAWPVVQRPAEGTPFGRIIQQMHAVATLPRAGRGRGSLRNEKRGRRPGGQHAGRLHAGSVMVPSPPRLDMDQDCARSAWVNLAPVGVI